MTREDHKNQFETMALIRAYATMILASTEGDCRPSVAEMSYIEPIERMVSLAKNLQKT